MNKTEKKMVELLSLGKENFGVVAVKAEFEAEGTRVDELLRLIDIAKAAQLPLTVKIGGCEAIRDLLESRQFGAKFIVAPMIETPYALSKYINAKNIVFSPEEQEDIDFLFNIETITGFQNLNEIIMVASQLNGVNGIVFGRSDYLGSLNNAEFTVNSNKITEDVIEVSKKCKEQNLDLVVGGGVSADALENLRLIKKIHLTRFETRKVVFNAEAVNIHGIEQGLLNAVHFEMLWLLNKRDYYGRITQEDANRIDTLESRWHVLDS